MREDVLAGAPIPADFVADLLGLGDAPRAALLQRLVPALARVDPELVPQALEHPYAEAITKGIGAYAGLLAEYRAQKTEDGRGAVLEAICQILEREHPTREVVEALQRIMQGTKSSALLSLAARALATAREPAFLEQQRQFLASSSPSELRRSARLLGHGRYAPAVPALLALLRPDNMAAADVAVWALGEIGDPAAVPALHAMLERFVLTEAVLDALGKIGARVSVLRILPVLLEGTASQRAAAARALARVADAQDGDLGDKALARTLREALEKVILGDPAVAVRFYALVAFAHLDGHLTPNQILTALGGGLAADELEGMGRLLDQSRPTRRPRKGRRPV